MQQLSQDTFLHGGTYKIIKILGQGSFGITYLAEHASLHRNVCIKEFFMKELNSRTDDGSITGMTEGSMSYNYALKFQKEAQNLSSLEHPNIVRVTDSFEENGTFYYTMDYIEGTNLNDYIKGNYISETEAVSIIRDVADALMYMHDKKHMLHLDLKPGNIMRRNSDGHIFLIDFGLSKHYSNEGQPETSTTIGLGTAGYAPIEQGNRAKNGEFRPTIDVYALGATLYKLLTRETPPAASDLVSDDELLIKNMRGKVSPNLINFVSHAMSPNVKKRIQTMREFKELLSGGNPLNESKHGGVDTDREETIIADNEKTIVSGTSAVIPAHPGFNAETYVVENNYKKFPSNTISRAKDGDTDAAIAYGIMALRGEGIKQDFDVAHKWLKFAKDKGDDRGEKLLMLWGRLKMKAEEKDSKSLASSSIIHSHNDSEGGFNTKKLLLVIMMTGFSAIIILALSNRCSKEPEISDRYINNATATETVDIVENNENESPSSYMIRNAEWNLVPLTESCLTGTVVIDSEGNVLSYLEENKDFYHVAANDDSWIPKSGCRKEQWSAIKGKGYVMLMTNGNVPFHSLPKDSAPVVSNERNEMEGMPNSYKCTGYENGWFQVSFDNGGTGYVKSEYVMWDAIGW